MVSFIASKTRSNRPGWSITFRHPVRTDSRGQRGLKVRRGLATDDSNVADKLVAELNELLADESWWTGERRAEAASKYSPIVVAAFFDDIEIGGLTPEQRRDELIAMPSRENGYSRVQFLGTTGAGKTTLLRHVIGSDPIEDRFPSTSTAKTTTADIEIITARGPFQAAVTFMPEHEVRAHVEECLEEACLQAAQYGTDAKIMGSLLQHREQRFRLSYILGSWKSESLIDDADFSFDDDTSENESSVDESEAVSTEESIRNAERLHLYLTRIKTMATEVGPLVTANLGRLQDQKNPDDRAAWLELFGTEVFKNNQFSELILDLVDDVSKRFEFISGGNFTAKIGEWPIAWFVKENDRTQFLSCVRWFSSNHHRQFGRLLTPLVNGIRVSGPLFPTQEELGGCEKLVLLDGEGLGHTATTVSSVSTRISQRFSTVDMILLVDNAQQPMQAAPLALLRSVGSSGFAEKLAVAFTHFDQVKGPNLGTFEHKRNHVIGSVTSAVTSLREIVGSGVAATLNRRIDRQSFFLGGLDRPTSKMPVGFRHQLAGLMQSMQSAAEPVEPTECAPIYEFKGLEIAIRDGIEAFRTPWRGRLGLAYHDGVSKEHWTRIKALSRRVANRWDNKEYYDLRPVADLLSSLQEEVSKWLERPTSWTNEPQSDEEREAALDRIRRLVFTRLGELTERRLTDEQVANWRIAYDYSGKGSATDRARMIDNINDLAAPHMSAAMSKDAREFLTLLYSILAEAIEAAGGVHRPIAASLDMGTVSKQYVS